MQRRPSFLPQRPITTRRTPSGDLPDFTCFVGTIIQEAYRTHPNVCAACEQNVCRHVQALEADIRAAMREHGVRGTWTPESLALHIQAVTQGGFILAKAKGSAAVAAESLDHLRRYLELLFGGGRRTSRATSKTHLQRETSGGQHAA